MSELPQPSKCGQGTVQADTSAIHPATYALVASANAGECWLCGLNGKNATRVVSTLDLPLLHLFQRRGIVQLADLDAFENLVFLCTACDVAFNDPVDVWVFLPASLDAFIAAEEAFQARCQSSALRGQKLIRPPGSSNLPGIPYARYQIRPGYLFTRVFTDSPTRTWPGSPLAAIIRSARIVAQFERLPVDQGGIPIDVALQLQHLLLLFGTPEPVIQSVVQSQEKSAAVSANNSDCQIVLQVRQTAPRPDGANQNWPGSAPFEPAETIPGLSADSRPDLAFVGRAFNSVLQYVDDRSSDHNMTTEARAWLTSEIRSVMLALKAELHSLDDHKDDPTLLPHYAFNRAVPLQLFSSTIPYVMVKYSTQFTDCLLKLYTACELDATCDLIPRGRVCLVSQITFASGGSQRESQTVGNKLFDPDFESEFVSAVQALTMEPN